MNQKANSTKLQILCQSNIERLSIEVNRIPQLYQAGRIRGLKGHELLHDATKDLHTIFWDITTEIGQAHRDIDNIRGAKNSSKGKGYLSQCVGDALQNLLAHSRLFRLGKSDYKELRTTAKLTQKIMKADVSSLSNEIDDMLYRARTEDPTDFVTQEEMSIKRISDKAILKPSNEQTEPKV